jgi:hypothetical protein
MSMQWFFSKDRRQESRRKREQRAIVRFDEDRRDSSRRLDERRSCHRISLPPGDTLSVIDSDPEYIARHFRVLDIVSEKSIRFVCTGSCDTCDMPVQIGSTIEATVEFHDESRIKTKGYLVRYCGDLESKNKTFVSVLEESLPAEVIAQEQEYLISYHADSLAVAD